MDMSEPATVVMPPGTAAVIRVLARADDSFTVRQIGRLAGVSHARAATVVEALAQHGVVHTEERGRARLCTLNREHLATPALVSLISMRRTMIDLLKREVESWPVRALHASVYGSAARGDGGVDSDIDVLVIRADDVDLEVSWSEQLTVTAERLRHATGNPVAWFDLSRAELRTATAANEPIVEQWRSDSVHLAGSTLAALLRNVA